MPKFTDLYIKNLPTKPARYDVREGDGFGVRVSPDGSRAFFYIYQLQGTKRRMTLGQYPAVTVKDARKVYEGARARVALGCDPSAERTDERERIKRQREEQAARLTVARLAEDYIERHAKPKKRTWAEDDATLNKEVLPVWGHRKAEDITRRDVNKLLDSIIDRGSPIRANRVLALVRKMFNFGIQRGELGKNPCQGLANPSPETPRDRVLTDVELRTLWAALESGTLPMTEPVALAVKMQLATGCRIGEIAGARWDEIDLSAQWWEIPAHRMKRKQLHRVWLTDAARAALARLAALQSARGPRSEWVFPSKDGAHAIHATSVTRAVARTVAHLGMVPFSPHDLRRTVATRLSEIGVLPHIVDKVLSHTDQTVRGKHYDKGSYDFEKRKALEAWAGRLREIVTGERPSNVIALAR
jgi:integrase